MLTFDRIKKMSNDEVAATNEELGKKLLKRIALNTLAAIAVVVVVAKIADKIVDSMEDADE